MPTIFLMGFRIFFLLAGLTASLLVPIWLAALSGHALPGVDLHWHGHELIFGFVGAVLAGFFLTAVPKWTATTPLSGKPLIALAALWAAGRAGRALLTGPLAAADSAFLFALAAAIGWPIFKQRSTRNALFPLLVVAMGLADVAWHLWPGLVPAQVAVLSAVVVVVIFGGRITPLFTRNALKLPVRPRSRLDDAAIGSVIVLIPLAIVSAPAPLVAAIAALGAALNLLRMRGWQTLATASTPLLWILHVGYGWVSVALALWALAALRPDILPVSTALHAATVGVLGTYTLGMMSRVALGHTGNPLKAPPLMVVAYVAVLLAGLLRLLAVLAPWALYASGTLWTVAFALFVVVYAPLLSRPRSDGAPG